MKAKLGRRVFLASVGGAALGASLRVSVSAFHKPSRELVSPLEPHEWDPGTIRVDPVNIEPFDDLTDVTPDEGLHSLLCALVPCWHVLKTSRILHAFRLWGPGATFPASHFVHPFESRIFSGADLESYLLDDRYYHRIVPGQPPLLFRTPHGVEVRTYSTNVSGNFVGELGHYDDLLTACAEVGLSTAVPIYAEAYVGSIKDLIRQSMARFTIGHELEWTVEALARYLAPRTSWSNTSGVTYDFDSVARAMLGRAYGRGACLGTHVPYSLTCLFRIDEMHKILSGPTRDRIASHLRETSLMLLASRQPVGWWAGRWAPGVDQFESNPFAEAVTGIVSTGHHLEWMALAPPDLRPARTVLSKAIQGALTLFGTLSVYDRSQCYLELSHLARALCLMKRRAAFDIVRPNAGPTAGDSSTS